MKMYFYRRGKEKKREEKEKESKNGKLPVVS